DRSVAMVHASLTAGLAGVDKRADRHRACRFCPGRMLLFAASLQAVHLEVFAGGCRFALLAGADGPCERGAAPADAVGALGRERGVARLAAVALADLVRIQPAAGFRAERGRHRGPGDCCSVARRRRGALATELGPGTDAARNPDSARVPPPVLS